LVPAITTTATKISPPDYTCSSSSSSRSWPVRKHSRLNCGYTLQY